MGDARFYEMNILGEKIRFETDESEGYLDELRGYIEGIVRDVRDVESKNPIIASAMSAMVVADELFRERANPNLEANSKLQMEINELRALLDKSEKELAERPLPDRNLLAELAAATEKLRRSEQELVVLRKQTGTKGSENGTLRKRIAELEASLADTKNRLDATNAELAAKNKEIKELYECI